MGPSAVLGGYALRTVTAWAKRQRGPLAITFAFLVLGMMNLILVPPFVARDESSHVTYALAIADGRFPRIDDTNPAGAIPGAGAVQDLDGQPPAALLRARRRPARGRQGDRRAGARAARHAPAEPAVRRRRGATWPARSARCCCRAGPRRRPSRRPALGLAGSVANTLAIAYNDGLGLAASVSLLVVGLRILREGPSRRLLVALALLAAVGSLARFTVFMAIGFAALLAAAGVYLERPARRLLATAADVLPAVRRGDRRVRLVVPPQPPRVRIPHRHELHHPHAGSRPARRLPRAAPDAVVLAQDALRHLGRVRAIRVARQLAARRSPRRPRRSASSACWWRSSAGGGRAGRGPTAPTRSRGRCSARSPSRASGRSSSSTPRAATRTCGTCTPPCRSPARWPRSPSACCRSTGATRSRSS